MKLSNLEQVKTLVGQGREIKRLIATYHGPQASDRAIDGQSELDLQTVEKVRTVVASALAAKLGGIHTELRALGVEVDQ